MMQDVGPLVPSFFVVRREVPDMATAPTRRRRPAPAPCPPAPPPDRLSVRIPVKAMTLAGFRDWATSPEFPEHVRAAFIDGEVYLDMSNEDPELHVLVKGEIVRVLQ